MLLDDTVLSVYQTIYGFIRDMFLFQQESLENGEVKCFDIRTANSDPSKTKPCFTLDAHDKAICLILYNPAAPNLLATGSANKMVKLWDLSNNQPTCAASKNRLAGGSFCIALQMMIRFHWL